MTADSDSHIAWQRAQVRKQRAALKELEIARFGGAPIPTFNRKTEQAISELKRKILEAERCIADYERRTKRPLATDGRSLASVSWSNWDANVGGTPQRRRA
ncbi:hypothetical protein AAFX91_31980 [Bradyrhizobium sp. 31Argb]|uniref:hypothetical protein n=1 Tax=unclassified Bradyrhizobium TaxID=2631580 RepID=UPI00102E50A3|nr:MULTISPECIES: hypothetical protein [unclassified Bradyrhizobium]MDI4233813.1 hypothetical protein [Bradyrhizobium sp. Arg237L]TAI66281.1 hypothetical protein CWO89_08855 [Bradyrhizobium sp. Leo170]